MKCRLSGRRPARVGQNAYGGKDGVRISLVAHDIDVAKHARLF